MKTKTKHPSKQSKPRYRTFNIPHFLENVKSIKGVESVDQMSTHYHLSDSRVASFVVQPSSLMVFAHQNRHFMGDISFDLLLPTGRFLTTTNLDDVYERISEYTA
jgi:hypothetical protein